MMFIICLQKNFKICIDKMIFLVYNRGGWAGIDNKNKYIIQYIILDIYNYLILVIYKYQ